MSCANGSLRAMRCRISSSASRNHRHALAQWPVQIAAVKAQ
jgi:hypothetical protein